MNNKGWIGFDLDGTLAHYEDWAGIDHIGDPIESMARKLRILLSQGWDCRIVTARVATDGTSASFVESKNATRHIQAWTLKHFGVKLLVGCSKDFNMVCLYDDRCVAVETNTGKVLGGKEPSSI